MVLANETVAEYMHAIEAPFIYRVHEKPSEDKARFFQSFAQKLGFTARFDVKEVKPYDYQNMLNNAKESPVYPLLNRVMLRSMQKARYSAENVGHFGLASDCYCHFTSPIRRYPDLCIHRIIKMVINGEYDKAVNQFSSYVEQAAEQSSKQERRATDAERDVDDLYKTMFMSEHLGETYEAVVSGVTSFGLFAELPNTIEGFIPIESLFGEYKYDSENLTLRGNNDSFTIGDTLQIKVIDVDFYRRRSEFRLLQKLS
jgi:ribonuclease R